MKLLVGVQWSCDPTAWNRVKLSRWTCIVYDATRLDSTLSDWIGLDWTSGFSPVGLRRIAGQCSVGNQYRSVVTTAQINHRHVGRMTNIRPCPSCEIYATSNIQPCEQLRLIILCHNLSDPPQVATKSRDIQLIHWFVCCNSVYAESKWRQSRRVTPTARVLVSDWLWFA
jgi:hypothetical protein